MQHTIAIRARLNFYACIKFYAFYNICSYLHSRLGMHAKARRHNEALSTKAATGFALYSQARQLKAQC